MKERIDVIIADRGLCESREKAKVLIMAGLVSVNGLKIDKPGTKIDSDSLIEIKEQSEFVSRGGYKLKKAIQTFDIDLKGRICADIGASTGGFTDCMLKNGASKIYAVDVGYGQLAWELRNDPRVINLERTNARYLSSEIIPEGLDFFSVDVAFISLSKILPAVSSLMNPEAECVCLIKPQFEAGREFVGKKGVVRDKTVHLNVINNIIKVVDDIGLVVKGLTYSPIKGPEGNIEYLIFSGKCGTPCNIDPSDIVEEAHNELDK